MALMGCGMAIGPPHNKPYGTWHPGWVVASAGWWMYGVRGRATGACPPLWVTVGRWGGQGACWCGASQRVVDPPEWAMTGAGQ